MLSARRLMPMTHMPENNTINQTCMNLYQNLLQKIFCLTALAAMNVIVCPMHCIAALDRI